MIQIVSHTTFWDMPWYEKLVHITFSINPDTWKSVRITDNYEVEYYSGLVDPTNTPVTWVYVQQLNYDDWKYN